MVQFNENTLLSSYIKELLQDFNLPTIHVLTENTIPQDNYCYIKDKSIVKYEAGVFKKIQSYYFNDEIKNVTKNLKTNTATYDSHTHEYLGDFLRFIRDYKKINLMSLYNCFSNNSPQALSITTDNFEFNTDDENYNFWMVPIKFFQNYTIKITCSTPIEVVAGFYSNFQMFTSKLDVNNIKKIYQLTYRKLENSLGVYDNLTQEDFKLYITNSPKFLNAEREFKLFIKIPKGVNPSITILEGNFKTNDSFLFELPKEVSSNVAVATGLGNTFAPRTFVGVSKDTDNNTAVSRSTQSQLLQRSFDVSVPFADRLIDYLLDNAITPIDEISRNIVRVQNKLIYKDEKNIQGDYIYNYYWRDDIGSYLPQFIGKWDTKLTDCIFTIAGAYNRGTSVLDSKYDILGYVDTSIEQVLGDYAEDFRYNEYEI